MVPLDVVAARYHESEDEARAEPPVTRGRAESEPPRREAPPQANVRHQDVPYGWRPGLDGSDPNVTSLRDSVLSHGLSNHLSVVVSGLPGSKGGKARVAAGLALALAQAGASVLLVEADFDYPELHQALDVAAPVNAGFSQQLNARAQRHALAPWLVMRCSLNLHLLVEGRLRSPGLLLSGEFENAIFELRPGYQVLIISGPPTTTPTDLLALDHLAQAAIMANGKQPASIHFGQHSLRKLAIG